jgi:hypothetical protein
MDWEKNYGGQQMHSVALLLLICLLFPTPALSWDHLEMDRGDLLAAQAYVSREVSPDLRVIRGTLKKTRGGQAVEMAVEAKTPGGLVVEVVKEFRGGNLLGEIKE